MRKRIFEIVETSSNGDKLSTLYDSAMMALIFVSLIPLAFKSTSSFSIFIDKMAAIVFSIDYILRLITADIRMSKGVISFVLYPFTPFAIIDLLSVLPSFTVLASGFRILKVFRLFRTLRVLRILRIIRYSKSIKIISRVVKSQKEALFTVGILAFGYILVSALIIFNVEPDTFDTFFDAIYWATVSLTTMGYGDIYPVTTIGRIVTMFSSFIGVAIVALPAGIITAGYMDAIGKVEKEEKL